MVSTLKFTKMHGAGNDFVVLDNTSGSLDLSLDLIKKLADRHLGIGADQVLVVEQPVDPVNDFRYRIFNADGQEVQQCGNGARCFAQYVLQQGLTDKRALKVETLAGVIIPKVVDSSLVKVDMGKVRFSPTDLPFDCDGLEFKLVGGLTQYRLFIDTAGQPIDAWVGVASMGNPHVVLLLDQAPEDDFVQHVGRILESHPRFPERVNVGFLTILEKTKACLRVYERGVGETLACGTGACAAAVIGMKMGVLANQVEIVKQGGTLIIEWDGDESNSVYMTGPTKTVFEGEFFYDGLCNRCG
jgi:diaminopimelate epimerase